jgi:hypothetical protein
VHTASTDGVDPNDTNASIGNASEISRSSASNLAGGEDYYLSVGDTFSLTAGDEFVINEGATAHLAVAPLGNRVIVCFSDHSLEDPVFDPTPLEHGRCTLLA